MSIKSAGVDRREGWLAQLQVGDEVAYEWSGRWGGSGHVQGTGTVEKITPSGMRIEIASNRGHGLLIFNHRGRETPQGKLRLCELTPALRERLERDQLGDRLMLAFSRSDRFAHLTLDTLRQIAALLDEAKKTTAKETTS